jgi:hypothetical protein
VPSEALVIEVLRSLQRSEVVVGRVFKETERVQALVESREIESGEEEVVGENCRFKEGYIIIRHLR